MVRVGLWFYFLLSVAVFGGLVFEDVHSYRRTLGRSVNHEAQLTSDLAVFSRTAL